MDLADFKRTEAPARPRSKLNEHASAINELRAEGYTLEQIRAFLATNNVAITVQRLSQFLKTESRVASPRGQIAPAQTPKLEPKSVGSQTTPTSSTGSGSKSVEQLAKEFPQLSRKQIQEKYIDQFEPTAPNPLLARFGKTS